MDKFDDLLKQKVEAEKENFTLPKSFEERVEQTLDELDSTKVHKQWYANKKVLSMVACFAFVLLVGVSTTSNKTENAGNLKLASDEQVLRDEAVQNDGGAESYGLNNSRAIINIDGVQSLTIKYLDQDTKYKNISNDDDIVSVIEFLSTLEVMNTAESVGAEWDFLIQVNGKVNSSIIIKDNIMSINDEVYQILNWNKRDLVDLYNSLEYEENYIKYCPTN